MYNKYVDSEFFDKTTFVELIYKVTSNSLEVFMLSNNRVVAFLLVIFLVFPMFSSVVIVSYADLNIQACDVKIGNYTTQNMYIEYISDENIMWIVPMGEPARLNIDELQFMLLSSSVAIYTGDVGFGEMYIEEPLTWTDTAISIQSMGNLYINAHMKASGSASIKVNTDQGDLLCGMSDVEGGGYIGSVTLDETVSLEINDQPYTLITSVGVEAHKDSSGNNTLQGIAHEDMLEGYYALANDIDASNTSTWNGSKGFATIASKSGVRLNDSEGHTYFTGRLNGLGHEINNIKIMVAEDSNTGLFGNIKGENQSILLNIGMTDGIIDSDCLYGVGLLAGCMYGTNSSIINCYSEGNITCSDYTVIGGLVGTILKGNIISSYSDVNIQGEYMIGGLIGCVEYANIIDSYSIVTIEDIGVGFDNSISGGLIGYSYRTTVSGCYAKGTVAGGTYVGGLMGGALFDHYIYDCYANCTVKGDAGVGGLIGKLNGPDAIVSSCNAIGTIEGNQSVGGLLGISSYDVFIEKSYSDTNVSTQGINIGGLVGYASSAEIIDSYTLGTTIGVENVGGVVGYCTVASIEDAVTISGCYANVSSETIGSECTGGIVGLASKNVFLVDCFALGSIKGSFATGGIAGVIFGDILHCYSDSDIEVDDIAGGLAGGLLDGRIVECYTESTIVGNGEDVSGMLGMSDNGYIQDCYNAGDVSGSAYSAGLSGWFIESTYQNVYSSGKIADMSSNAGLIADQESSIGTGGYWDIETSNQSTSLMSESGLTTAQMMQKDSYENWNIETVENVEKEHIWVIQNGYTYALLNYFAYPYTNCKLLNVSFNTGTLSPGFDSDHFSYVLYVDKSTSKIKVRPSLIYDVNKIEVSGAAVNNGDESDWIELSDEDTTLTVTGISNKFLINKAYSIVIKKSDENELNNKTKAYKKTEVILGDYKIPVKERTIYNNNGKYISVTVNEWIVKRLISQMSKGEHINDENHNMKRELVLQSTTKNINNYTASISYEALSLLKQNDIDIYIKTEKMNYMIPSSEIVFNNNNIEQQYLDKGNIKIKMERVSKNILEEMIINAFEDEISILMMPVEFSVYGSFENEAHEKKEFEVNAFSKYVNKELRLEGDIEPSMVDTGFYYSTESGFSRVPTTYFESDGENFIRISSLSNSIYTVARSERNNNIDSQLWAKNEIECLYKLCILDFHETPDFEQPISRSVFNNMLMKAIGMNEMKNKESEGVFEAPICRSMSIAYTYDILKGYDDLSMNENRNIIKEEAIVMIGRYLKYIKGYEIGINTDNDFDDYVLVSDWAKAYVDLLVRERIIEGNDQGLLEPLKEITYEEASIMICNLMKCCDLMTEM